MSETKREKFERCYGGQARHDWIEEQPCIVCRRLPSEPAHSESGGKGRKANAGAIVPLCCDHHHELHQHGIKTFEHVHGATLHYRTLREWATAYDTIWRKLNPTDDGLDRATPDIRASDLRGAVQDKVSERNPTDAGEPASE